MSAKYTDPKDKTNPLAYVPIALIAIGAVSWVFVSGYMRGVAEGQNPHAVVLKKSAKPKPNIKAMANPTADLVSKGRQAFELNCASCHGKEGYGDGEKGKSLNPPPRNFHSASAWKNGPTVGAMWLTLQNGVPGSSMGSYMMMPEEERIAIIHFIRETWVPEKPALTPQCMDTLPGGDSASGGGATVAGGGTAEGPSPEKIAVAMVAYEKPAPVVLDIAAPESLASHPGRPLYDANCAVCHGPGGGGVKSNRVLTTYPFVRVSTAPFAGSNTDWVGNEDSFVQLLLAKDPGHRVHGFATFTKDEFSQLHDYVGQLAKQGRQQ